MAVNHNIIRKQNEPTFAGSLWEHQEITYPLGMSDAELRMYRGEGTHIKDLDPSLVGVVDSFLQAAQRMRFARASPLLVGAPGTEWRRELHAYRIGFTPEDITTGMRTRRVYLCNDGELRTSTGKWLIPTRVEYSAEEEGNAPRFGYFTESGEFIPAAVKDVLYDIALRVDLQPVDPVLPRLNYYGPITTMPAELSERLGVELPPVDSLPLT